MNNVTGLNVVTLNNIIIILNNFCNKKIFLNILIYSNKSKVDNLLNKNESPPVK